MKLNLNDFKRKWQFPVLMACGTLPATLVAQIAIAPQLLNLMWVFPAAYLLMALLTIIIPGKRRLPVGLVFCAVLIAMGIRLYPIGEMYTLLIIPLIYVTLLLAGMPIGGWTHDEEIHTTWYVIGVLCHVAGQLGVLVNQRSGMYPAYEQVSPVLVISFIGFALLSMLSMNRGTMANASMSRQRIPALMRHRNTLLTFAFLGLVLLLSAIPAVIRAVQAAWDWFLATVIYLLKLLTELIPMNSSGGGSGGPNELSALGSETAEPSLLVQILEKIAIVLAILIGAVLVILALRFLWKKLVILAKYLWKKFSEYAASTSEDYEDEITDTRQGGEKERVNVLSTLRKRLTRVDESKLTPVERIRYRYQRLMLRHPEWTSSQTARETLPDPSAQLYERARYSGQELSAQEAEDFAAKTKSL